MSERTREAHRKLIDAIQAGREDQIVELVRDLLTHLWFDSKLSERHYII